MTTHENTTATFDHPAERPATAARVAADWLVGIADHLDAGHHLDTFDALWPLLVVQAKVAEIAASVDREALRSAELRFFGRVS